MARFDKQKIVVAAQELREAGCLGRRVVEEDLWHSAPCCRLGRLRKRAQFQDPIAFLSNRPLRALFSSVSRAALRLNPALQRRPGRVKGSRQRRDRVNIAC
jgi:hypothetical protein